MVECLTRLTSFWKRNDDFLPCLFIMVTIEYLIFQFANWHAVHAHVQTLQHILFDTIIAVHCRMFNAFLLISFWRNYTRRRSIKKNIYQMSNTLYAVYGPAVYTYLYIRSSWTTWHCNTSPGGTLLIQYKIVVKCAPILVNPIHTVLVSSITALHAMFTD